MNKQEAIEELRNIKLPNNPISTASLFLSIVEEIDEPEKPVIPQFVADWLEWCKNNHLTLSESLSADECDSDSLQTEVNSWFTDNREELFARAWLDGYEVE